MIANDIFSEELAIAADLMLQECLLWSRAELFDRLTSASLSQNQETLETLRLDAMSQFAEFFYLIRARKIETTEQIARLAEIHNEHLDLLCREGTHAFPRVQAVLKTAGIDLLVDPIALACLKNPNLRTSYFVYFEDIMPAESVCLLEQMVSTRRTIGIRRQTWRCLIPKIVQADTFRSCGSNQFRG